MTEPVETAYGSKKLTRYRRNTASVNWGHLPPVVVKARTSPRIATVLYTRMNARLQYVT